MHRTRNAAYGQPYRGFESLPLRQTVVQRCSQPPVPDNLTVVFPVIDRYLIAKRSAAPVLNRVLPPNWAKNYKDVELAAYDDGGNEIHREQVVVRRSSAEPDRPNDVGLGRSS